MEINTNVSELGIFAEMGILNTICCCFEGVKGFNEVDPISLRNLWLIRADNGLICVSVHDETYLVDDDLIIEKCSLQKDSVVCTCFTTWLHWTITISGIICGYSEQPKLWAIKEEIQKIKDYYNTDIDGKRPWLIPSVAYAANALLKHIQCLESKNNYYFSQYWRYVFQTFFGDEWGLIQIPIDDTLKAVNESFALEYRAARKPAGFPATCQVEAPTDANDGAPGIDERRQEAINKLVAIGMNKDKAAEAVNALQKKANEHNGIALGRFVVDVYDEQNIMKSLFLKAFAPIAREYYGKTEKDRGFSLKNITTHRYKK